MRAGTSAARPRFPLRSRTTPHTSKTLSRRYPSSAYVIPLCASMLIAGYLPGIWLGHDGQTALGQQLAKYYADVALTTPWFVSFLRSIAGPFLQIVFVLLCGFSALGLGFLLLYFLGKGFFLGFCAANVFFAGGISDLVAYWLCTCLPDLVFTAVHLWLAAYALCLSHGLFQSVFLGGAPRGQLHAANRRLLVRSGVALFVSGLLGIIFSGLRFLLSPLFL